MSWSAREQERKGQKFQDESGETPVHSPSQPLENTIGAIALYLLALVVVTSYLRLQLSRHLWKSFHFSIYFAATALFVHSLFTDPALKGDPIDWFDGGKVFVEACFVLIVVVSVLRWRYSRKKATHRRQQVSRQPATSLSCEQVEKSTGLASARSLRLKNTRHY